MSDTTTHASTEADGVSELLPCPFCGGPVKLERTIDDREWWGVVCRNAINRGGTCAIQQRPSASKDAAIARWNLRSPVEATVSDAAEQLQSAGLAFDAVRDMLVVAVEGLRAIADGEGFATEIAQQTLDAIPGAAALSVSS